MHDIDFNYELHFHIADIQQMLENSLSNKGSLGVSDNHQLIKIQDASNTLTIIDETANENTTT